MKYEYKDYVTKIEIDENSNKRYMLYFELNNGDMNKSALVIMQNPSQATKEISDQTINTVLETLHRFKYHKVFVANLIPFYGTNSAEIATIVENNVDEYKYNDSKLKGTIGKVSKIFVAWGGANSFSREFYNKRIESVKKMLDCKPIFCYKKNKDGTPIHPSRNQWPSSSLEEDFEQYIF